MVTYKNKLFILLKLTLLLVIATNGSVVVYGQVKAAANYPYLIYLPKAYGKNTKKYPVVIYLHGGSQKGNNLNKLKTYGLPYLVDKGKNFKFIIVSPQCPDNKFWSSDNWFDSLYATLVAHYNIDTNRIYLTGVSMGGYGTYIVAMDHPKTFAALIPLCGGCNDEDTSRICSLKNMPIWAFHGTADDKVPISNTERIYDALKMCTGKMRFTRLKNKGHSIEYLYQTKPGIYKWMLKQYKSN